jgi:hypothetical protein
VRYAERGPGESGQIRTLRSATRFGALRPATTMSRNRQIAGGPVFYRDVTGGNQQFTGHG